MTAASSDVSHPQPLPTYAIVLAAGAGSRLGAEKQFLTVGGQRPVDMAVRTALEVCQHVVVVLPAERAWDGPDVDEVVEGGVDRRASVRLGLDAIRAVDGVVVVHQAANPLATTETLDALVSAVESGAPAAVPGLRPADVVRRVRDGEAGEIVGRDDLVLVQAPAAFRLEVLRAAHRNPSAALEDTALVTAAGYRVRILPGDPRNVHVATVEDLELVRALLQARTVGSHGDCRGDQGRRGDDNER